MQNYLTRRLLLMIPTVLVVSLVIFYMFRLLPGDVALNFLTDGGRLTLDREQYDALRAQLGLDRPLFAQYLSWLWDMVRLNGGTSLVTGEPVFNDIARKLPVTAELAALSLLISFAIAVPVGVIGAIKQDSVWDYLGRTFAISGLAMPNFLVGALVFLVLVKYFQWIPPLEFVSLTDDPLENLTQLIFPALVLGHSNSAALARMTRSSMLEVLRQDYVRTARAKGLPARMVIGRHALRNALLPILTVAGVQAGTLLAGAVIVEEIFVLPGIGSRMVDAIFGREWITVQTIVTLFAVMILSLNVVIDALYSWLDPRIRYET